MLLIENVVNILKDRDTYSTTKYSFVAAFDLKLQMYDQFWFELTVKYIDWIVRVWEFIEQGTTFPMFVMLLDEGEISPMIIIKNKTKQNR